MARQRLEIGALGALTCHEELTKDGVKRWTCKSSMRIATGELKRITAQGKTKTSAQAALHRKVESVRNATAPLSAKNPTVKDALTHYLKTLQVMDPDHRVRDSTAIRGQTVAQYKNDAQNLNKIMGRLQLRDLNVPTVQKALESLIDRSTGEGATRAKQAKGTLKRALDEAVRMGELSANPVLAVKLPRQGVRIVDAPGKETLQQIRQILEDRFAEKRPGPKPSRRVLHTIEIMLSTGCRIGEVLALRWQDIDFEGRTATISGTVIDRGSIFRQGYTKTDVAHSVLSLTNRAIEALYEARAETGPVADLAAPIFPTRNGTYTSPANVRRSLRTILEASEVKLPNHITPHSFRRAVATALAESVGIEAAALQLRHKDPRTTITHYIGRSGRSKDQTHILGDL